MKSLKFVFLFLICFQTSAFAQGAYLIHGLDGRDLGVAQSAVVDVVINGNCLYKGISYGQVTGPFPLSPGVYDTQVRLTSANCNGPVLLTERFDIAINEILSVVIHVNEQGAPDLSKFTNDQRKTEGTKARIMIRHLAGISPFSVRLKRYVLENTRLTSGTVLPTLKNGAQQQFEVNPSKYSAQVFTDFGTKRKIISVDAQASDDRLAIIYVLGSEKGNTMNSIVQYFETNK